MAMRGAAASGRDPELEDVLADLERRLQTIEHLRARAYDDKLAVVEELAAPYALAFLHEIRRLDRLVRPRQSRSRHRSRARRRR